MAWADDGSIVLDLVRHGESTANAAGIIDTHRPGTALDATGDAEATTVANSIIQRVRDQHRRGLRLAGAPDLSETAQPLVAD